MHYLVVEQHLGLATAAIDEVFSRSTHNLKVIDRPSCIARIGHGVQKVILPRDVKERVLVNASRGVR